MTLIVGSKRFPLNTGFQTQDGEWVWTNTGITWTEGQKVNIGIEVPVAETPDPTAPRNLRAQIVDGRRGAPLGRAHRGCRIRGRLRDPAPPVQPGREDVHDAGVRHRQRRYHVYRRHGHGARGPLHLPGEGNQEWCEESPVQLRPGHGAAAPRRWSATSASLRTTTATITQQYAQGFRLGKHGQGYAISSVSIELAAVPSDLTVSLWIGGVSGGSTFSGNVQRKVFDFANPSSFRVGLNKFTAPAGAFAYPNVNYWIVLSGFGSSLQVRETTSDDQDQGGETGAVISNNARQRGLTATGRWGSYSTRSNVLRLALEGSRRDRGILASSLAQTRTSQEIISLGDKCCFDNSGRSSGSLPHPRSCSGSGQCNSRLVASSASRSLVGSASSAWPLQMPDQAELAQHALSGSAGLNEWVAPQGATVAGSKTYTIGNEHYEHYWGHTGFNEGRRHLRPDLRPLHPMTTMPRRRWTRRRRRA